MRLPPSFGIVAALLSLDLPATMAWLGVPPVRPARGATARMAEFGEISASSTPPRLDPALIESAFAPLPWEAEGVRGGDVEAAALLAEDIATGEGWRETREILTRLWILPRDMSNGSWEAYAAAANAGEDKMLAAAPQLLRLPPAAVERSARTVLKVLGLPPALLRREPLLLAVPPDRLLRGFESLLLKETEGRKAERTEGAVAERVTEDVRGACRDTTGLLLGAATDCGIGGIRT